MHQSETFRQTDNINTRASTHMKFRVKSTSWRLTAPSDFLFNTLILKFLKFALSLKRLKFTTKQFSKQCFVNYILSTLKLSLKNTVAEYPSINI